MNGGITIKKYYFIFILLIFSLILNKKSYNKNIEEHRGKDDKDFENNELSSSRNTKTIKKKFRRKLRVKSKSGEPLDLNNLKFNMNVE